MANVLHIYHDSRGGVLRMTLNGMTLPVGGDWTVDQSLDKPPVARVTLLLDAVEFHVGEIDGTVVEAEVTPRRLLSSTDAHKE